jgi:hypothetical protein
MAKISKSSDPADIIGEVIFSAIKPLYREGERLRRGSSRRSRRRYYDPAPPRWTQKEIVFGILPRAIESAGDLFSARDLYYAARPLCYAHHGWSEGKQLGYGYFSQRLLTEYQEIWGPIAGLWRDPRGHLHEPHTGRVLALGTREVAAYEFPPYTFDKVLYVEKEGEMPKLKAAQLAERYDMAIVSGKGYPAEAVRTLFERAEGGDYQLFAFHDADVDGYNIARVMREATRRMPTYSVEVVDIGLTVEDALEMNLDSEPFSRMKSPPEMLYGSLSPVADEYFIDRHERFELNAILPDTRRIEYIEGKLEENGVRGKVIPPDDALKERCEAMYRERVGGWVDEAIAELLQSDELKENIAKERQERFGLEGTRGWIEEGFESDSSKSWRGTLDEKLEELYKAEHENYLCDAVSRHVRELIAGDEETL